MIDLIEVLAATYGREVPPEAVAVWCNVFADTDTDRVINAARAWIETQPRFPTPADIRTTMRATGEPARMALPHTTERVVPFPEGIAIAYAAYCAERRRQGRSALSYAEFRGSGWIARMAAQEGAQDA